MKRRHGWQLSIVLAIVGLSLGIVIIAINTTYFRQSQATSSEQVVHLPATLQQDNQKHLKQVKKTMARQHFLGTVEMFRHGQKLVVSTGDANHQLHQRNSLNRPFPICSITKFLTSIMIEQLVTEHKLSMNTKLNHFYPKVPFANQITIRELLDHDSGISMPEKAAPHILMTQDQGINYNLQNLRVSRHHT